jgi:hypothetical protein
MFQKGYVQSAEHKARIGQANRGKKRSAATILKLSQAHLRPLGDRLGNDLNVDCQCGCDSCAGTVHKAATHKDRGY